MYSHITLCSRRLTIKAQNVYIPKLWRYNLLGLKSLPELKYPVTHVSCLFKSHLIRQEIHLLLESLNETLFITDKKKPNVFHYLQISFFCNSAGAWRATPLHLVLDTCSHGFVQQIAACPYQEISPYKGKGFPHSLCRDIRAKVEVAIPFNFPHNLQPRPFLCCAKFYVRIILIIPENDVKLWFMLFYESCL